MTSRQCGAYALALDPLGRLLLVRSNDGRYYLPGGRIENGEDARSALQREIAEECGWSAEIEARVGDARQPIMRGSVDLEATYWRVRLTERTGQVGEHEMLWVAPEAAFGLLHRSGDRAVVANVLRIGVERLA